MSRWHAAVKRVCDAFAAPLSSRASAAKRRISRLLHVSHLQRKPDPSRPLRGSLWMTPYGALRLIMDDTCWIAGRKLHRGRLRRRRRRHVALVRRGSVGAGGLLIVLHLVDGPGVQPRGALRLS